jgi:choline-sulfatase
MTPNLLLIVSDQHHPRCAGFAGHPVVHTPNLDALAASGTTFRSAYCASPICVPARASIATGRYVFQHRCWDNAAPYAGDPPSWGHRLIGAGYDVSTVGKLHYRDADCDTGTGPQILPMHVHGRGDLRGLVHRATGTPVPSGTGSARIAKAGVGETEYTRYDRAVADAAARQIHRADPARPFAITASFVSPHFPWLAPQDYADRYADAEIAVPASLDAAWRHPAVDEFRSAFGLDDLPPAVSRTALRAYFGLCSFLDTQVGRVLDALAASGRAEDTLVIYTSDHGESAGAHGLWFKHLMNEESAGVPLVLRGPGVPAGAVVHTPVSHVDLYPTILQAAGIPLPEADLPGVSLLDVARGDRPDRVVLSEYHANGSLGASFLVRSRRYKYIEYARHRPQLFDLIDDPGETVDLAADPAQAGTLRRLAQQLRGLCSPEAVDEQARADQRERIERAGGVRAALSHTVEYTPAPSLDDPDRNETARLSKDAP